MSFFNDVFPTLMFSGFFVAVGLIIAWSTSGLNFDLAIRQKPWRRKVILGLGIYILVLCLLRIADAVMALTKGYDVSPKEITVAVLFLGLAIAVIRGVYKPRKIV